MTIAIRHPVDPRALVEASQAVRGMIGVLPSSWPVIARRSDIPTPGCRWTPRETDKLMELAGTIRAKKIADVIGRPYGAVRSKAAMLGLSVRVKAKPRELTDAERERSRAIFAGCYPAMRPVIRSVSERTGIPIDSLLSQQRVKAVSRARRVLLWTLARDTKLAMKQMGDRLKIDHSSVIYAITKEDEARGTNVRALRNVKNGGRPK